MRLHVHRWGSGPEVVLVHGGGHSGREAWVGQRPLTERWTLLAVDRVGHGRSPDGRQDFDVDARLIGEQLLDVPRHVVGLSYGAVVAALAAAQRPEGVRSLVLVEPPAAAVAPEHPAVAAHRRRVEAEMRPGREDPVDILRTFTLVVGAWVTIPDALSPSMARAALALSGARPPAEAQIPLAALAAAPFPILCVTGGHDEVYEVIADTIAAATGARRCVIAGGGHLVPEVGEAFNEVLEGFLADA